MISISDFSTRKCVNFIRCQAGSPPIGTSNVAVSKGFKTGASKRATINTARITVITLVATITTRAAIDRTKRGTPAIIVRMEKHIKAGDSFINYPNSGIWYVRGVVIRCGTEIRQKMVDSFRAIKPGFYHIYVFLSKVISIVRVLFLEYMNYSPNVLDRGKFRVYWVRSVFYGVFATRQIIPLRRPASGVASVMGPIRRA